MKFEDHPQRGGTAHLIAPAEVAGDRRASAAIGRRLRGSRPILLGLLSLAGLALGPAATPAAAAKPTSTDVIFILDTSGSMSGVLTESREEVKTLASDVAARLPNVDFAVSSVEDLPGYAAGGLAPTSTEAELLENLEKPWHLWQPLTGELPKIEAALNNLESKVAHSGGDLPEAYGRALWESATNPEVGWRAGARHEIVLVGDNVPHTPNVNEGIPANFQFTEANNDAVEKWPNTGEELGGKFGIPNTQWKEGESLEFHKTLERLKAESKPLAMVDYHHTGQTETSNYIHYWEFWAAATGGQAVTSEEGSKTLAAKLAGVITEGSEGIPPCPPGSGRTLTSPCHVIPMVEKHPPVVIESTGEVELEFEAPEPGEFEFNGEVLEGAMLARVSTSASLTGGGSPLLAELRSQGAGAAAQIARKRGGKKCKTGYVKKGRRCVNNRPVVFGSGKVKVAKAGVYKFRVKPSSKVRKALRKGRHLHVKVNVYFTPTGIIGHGAKSSTLTLHLKHGKGHHH